MLFCGLRAFGVSASMSIHSELLAAKCAMREIIRVAAKASARIKKVPLRCNSRRNCMAKKTSNPIRMEVVTATNVSRGAQ